MHCKCLRTECLEKNLGPRQCTGEVTLSGADQSDSHDRTAISFSENDPLKSVAMTGQTDVCLTA